MKIITRNDVITKTIDKKINYIEQNYHTFLERREQINKLFLDFYSNIENYTYSQLITRRSYLEDCEENAGKIFTNYFRSTYISLLTALLLSFAYSIYYLIKQLISPEDLQDIVSQLPNIFIQIMVFILLVIIIIVLSYASAFSGRKYRKYHTIQLEIGIIESIIENRFKDDDLTRTIIDNINQNRALSDTSGESD